MKGVYTRIRTLKMPTGRAGYTILDTFKFMIKSILKPILVVLYVTYLLYEWSNFKEKFLSGQIMP